MTQKKVDVRQRTSYSLDEKLVVVRYAQENGRNTAAKHFNLDPPMVGRWIKQSSRFAVNYISIRLQMCKIFKESAIQTLYPAGEYEFQGNLSWINSFMKRFDLSLRRRTKISQKLPEDIEQKLDEF
ncbi:plectin-like isoform X1 [Rhizophagus clarus]|uniref:Plectin-like isoform X1 n=1 Tax=Rhizophagus clarus TaxID=94130 RepID=A0A8H3LFF3_9GLOM|nr:plectin-like isoform X1 [Rhizophagus clarus]